MYVGQLDQVLKQLFSKPKCHKATAKSINLMPPSIWVHGCKARRRAKEFISKTMDLFTKDSSIITKPTAKEDMFHLSSSTKDRLIPTNSKEMECRRETTTVLKVNTSRAVNSRDYWFGKKVSRNMNTMAISMPKTSSTAKVRLLQHRHTERFQWSIRRIIQKWGKTWHRALKIRKWAEVWGRVPAWQKMWEGHDIQL